MWINPWITPYIRCFFIYILYLVAGLYKAEKAEKNDMMLYINDIADNDFGMNVQHGYKMARTLL